MTQVPPKRPPLREERAEIIGGVLGLLTHDLRNPLAALSSNVGFLSMVGDNFSEEVREALADVHLSIEALTRIVDSLELLAHDLGTLHGPVNTAVRVADVLRSVIPPVARAADSHGVFLARKNHDQDEARILVGEVYFSRSLAALLLNAITVTPPKSTVELDVFREPSAVVFRVTDEGPALEPVLAEAALSAAGQVEVKTARGGRYSRGLGLYVVARAAEMAGARVRVGSSSSGSVIDLICNEAK